MIVLLYIFPLHSLKRTIGFVFCVGARATAQYLLILTTLLCLVLSQACSDTGIRAYGSLSPDGFRLPMPVVCLWVL